MPGSCEIRFDKGSGIDFRTIVNAVKAYNVGEKLQSVANDVDLRTDIIRAIYESEKVITPAKTRGIGVPFDSGAFYYSPIDSGSIYFSGGNDYVNGIKTKKPLTMIRYANGSIKDGVITFDPYEERSDGTEYHYGEYVEYGPVEFKRDLTDHSKTVAEIVAPIIVEGYRKDHG